MSKDWRDMVWLGAQVHIFCSALQSALRCRVLSKENKVEDENGQCGSDCAWKEKKETPVFEGELTQLSYAHAVDAWNHSTAACNWQHTNVAEKAIRFWCKGSSTEEVTAQLSYPGGGEVTTTFPWWINEMNHINLGPAQEWVVVFYYWTSGGFHARRQEQNGVVSMRDIFGKLRPPRLAIDGPCAGTYATTNACMFYWGVFNSLGPR